MGLTKFLWRAVPLVSLTLVMSCVEAPTVRPDDNSDSVFVEGKEIGGNVDPNNVRIITNEQNVKVKPKSSPWKVNFSTPPSPARGTVPAPTVKPKDTGADPTGGASGASGATTP
jgi:hypothetical protein